MTTTFTDGAPMWNQRFAGQDYLFGREPNNSLRTKASLMAPGGRVLCVANGEGRNSVWLARQGMKVEAFDVTEAGVAKAQRPANEQGV